MPRYSPVAKALSYPMDNEDGIDRLDTEELCCTYQRIGRNLQRNDEHAGRAGGLKTSMEKFSTFFSLKLSHFLFAASEQLSLSLQSKDISAQEAFKAASLTKSIYHRQRNDENFDKFYLSVLQESERTNIFLKLLIVSVAKIPTALVSHRLHSSKAWKKF